MKSKTIKGGTTEEVKLGKVLCKPNLAKDRNLLFTYPQ